LSPDLDHLDWMTIVDDGTVRADDTSKILEIFRRRALGFREDTTWAASTWTRPCRMGLKRCSAELCKEGRRHVVQMMESVDNLGVLYRSQGKLGAAEKTYSRALQVKEKAFGPDHTSTLNEL
jgi:Tetratricopeptide repeat